jgi:hypothetical protein
MKKELFANSKMSFDHFSSSDFEEIVFDYFQIQIDEKLFEGIYDKVELSVGVGEKGADVKIYYNSKVVGCVQCKHLKKNVSDKTVLEDIIKYIMHHILLSDKNGSSVLIDNVKNFTYYIAVSGDFTQKAKDLINEFTHAIKNENLKKFVLINQSKYSQLRDFDYKMNESLLFSILEDISVKSINKVTLDKFLRTRVNVLQRYFHVETVLSTDALDDLNKSIEKSTISEKETNDYVQRLNSHFVSIKQHFGNNDELKIERDETNKILNWINSPLKKQEKNLAILAANAGYGKTVILSQLIEKLNREKRTVIALKADRFNVEDHKKLAEKIDLPVTFSKFVSSAIEYSGEIILVIDQIDALSQSLSTNMRALQVFDDIIQSYLGNPKVRIVVSCRIFDLNYDPLLKRYSDNNTFKVHKLDDGQIRNILSKAEIIEHKDFSHSLIQLLKTPLHLDIFLNIYSKVLKIDKIKTLQDMYEELWNQKLSNPSIFSLGLNQDRVIKLIYSISNRMFENQEINTTIIPYQDKFASELRYLESAHLLVRNKELIEFFHQSFFEYVIARHFVSDEKNIAQDIKNKHQGLFLRSKIHQILNYKRSVDPSSYNIEIKEIIEDNSIRLHVKALVLQLIAFHENPTTHEISLVKSIFSKNNLLKELFVSYHHGKDWLEIFIKNNWIVEMINSSDENTYSLIGAFLRRQSKINTPKVLGFFHEHKHQSIFREFIIDFLWIIESFDDTKYLDLVENTFQENSRENNRFSLYYILRHAIREFPDWLSTFIYNNYPKDVSFDNFDFQIEFFPGASHNQELYKDFWETHPKKSYDLVKKIILQIINDSSVESDDFEHFASVSKAFLLYTHKEDHMYFHHVQLKNLYEYLIGEYKNNAEFVISEVLSFVDYEKVNIHKFMIGLKVMNSLPSAFKDTLLEIYLNPSLLKKLLGLEQYVNYLIYNSFGRVYRVWEDNEKARVIDVILSFYPDYEVKKISKKLGYSMYTFLSQLDPNDIQTSKLIRNKYNELKRKFGEISRLKEPKGIVTMMGGNLLPNSAYENMSLRDWKKSFLKYDESRPDYSRWNDISELEHSRMFTKKVKENPMVFFPLIEEILDDKHISNNYLIKGIEGLVETSLSRTKISSLVIKTIKSRELDPYQNTQLLWVIQKIIQNNALDEQLLDFVLEIAQKGNESKYVQSDLLTNGANSERGAAVFTLMDITNSKYSDLIIQSIKSIALKSNQSTRACALVKLANFLKVSRKDSFDVFRSIVYDYSPGLVKLSPNFLTYSTEDEFINQSEFYSKAIFVSEASEAVGQLLTKFYCYNYKDSDKLLNEFINQSENNAAPVINIAWKFIQSFVKGEPKIEITKALDLISRFLDAENEKIAKSYNFPFYHLEIHHFNLIKDFLYKFVESNAGKFREDSFYIYLSKCTREYPIECIQLASKFENHIDFKIEKRVLRNEPLNVIISAYNQIREYDKSDTAVEEAMNVFDKIMQNSKLRDSAFDVLVKLDY